MEREKERLKYLAAVVETAADIIAVLDASRIFSYVSPSITTVLGYSAEEMIGRDAFMYIHPEDHERVAGIFATNLRNKGVIEKTELRYRHRDGSWRYLECRAKNLLFDPQVRGVVIGCRDVSGCL